MTNNHCFSLGVPEGKGRMALAVEDKMECAEKLGLKLTGAVVIPHNNPLTWVDLGGLGLDLGIEFLGCLGAVSSIALLGILEDTFRCTWDCEKLRSVIREH